jgi:hypothetical protein
LELFCNNIVDIRPIYEFLACIAHYSRWLFGRDLRNRSTLGKTLVGIRMRGVWRNLS